MAIVRAVDVWCGLKFFAGTRCADCSLVSRLVRFPVLKFRQHISILKVPKLLITENKKGTSRTLFAACFGEPVFSSTSQIWWASELAANNGRFFVSYICDGSVWPTCISSAAAKNGSSSFSPKMVICFSCSTFCHLIANWLLVPYLGYSSLRKYLGHRIRYYLATRAF
jgi:hypothetical protein